MKFWQGLVGAGAALMVFFAIIQAENQVFEVRARIQNPFTGETALDDRIVVPPSRAYSDFYLSSGGFVRAFANTSLNFSAGNRIIEAGEAFVIGGINTNEPERVMVLGTSIDISESGVLVSLRDDKNSAEIFAIAGPVQLNLPAISEPIMLPFGMKMTLQRNQQFSRVEQSSYRKIRTSLEFEPWSAEKQITIERTWEAYQIWTEQFARYAREAPFLWGSPTSDLGLIRSIDEVKNIRNQVIPLPDKKSQKFVWQRLLRKLIDGLSFLRSGNTVGLLGKANEFQSVLRSDTWRTFLRKHPDAAKDWAQFVQAQRIWLRSLDPQNPVRQIFFGLWFPELALEKSPIDQLWLDLRAAEFFLPSALQKPVVESFERIIENTQEQVNEDQFFGLNRVESRPVSAEKLAELTAFRRRIGAVIRAADYLQTPTTYELYEAFILAEVAHDRPALEQTDLILEIATDVLAHMRIAIEKQSDKETAQIFIRILNTIKAQDRAAAADENLFDEAALKTIEFVTLAGQTSVSLEDIEAIAAEEAKKEALARELAELEKGVPSEEILDPGMEQIKNVKNLIDFLAEQGVGIDLTNLKTWADREETEFSNATFLSVKIRGIFEYSTQIFRGVSIGDSQYDAINTNGFLRALDREENLLEQAEKVETPSSPPDSETSVRQNTEEAIIARRLTQALLTGKGLDMSRENIRLTENEDYDVFEVREVRYPGGVTLNFTFKKSAESFSNISVLVGNAEQTLTGPYGWEALERQIETVLKNIRNQPNE